MKYKTTVNLKNSRSKSSRSRSSSSRKKSKSGKVRKLSRAELALNQMRRTSSRKKKKYFKGKYLSEVNRKRLRKALLAVGLIVSVLVIVGGVFFLSYLQKLSVDLPDPNDPFKAKELASEIFDRNGEPLYKIFNEYNRDEVDIEEVPQQVRWAFLAAEDRDFYDHPGFDVTAIIRCALRYVRDGSASCGGSTITQQTLKITSLYNEYGVERKLKEVLMALQVERLYEKEEILQMYLTVAPFGANMYGLTTASDFYFGKTPEQLTLAQSAILASIINDPSILSPTLSIDPEYADENLIERAHYVLDQIELHKDFINTKTEQVTADDENPVTEDLFTQETIDEAREELDYAQDNKADYYREPIATNKKAGHFVNYVMEMLQERPYKNNEEPFDLSDLQTGGYKVYTTLDYNLQQIAERYAQLAVDDYGRWRGGYNSAVMTMVPSTGEIITMVGSRNFNAGREACSDDGTCKFDPQVNVLNTLQSAGSSMKPMGYYLAYSTGAAFPGTIVPDIPVEWGSYKPKNVDNRFNGFSPEGTSSTAQNQLRLSRNLPALQILESVGVSAYVNEAQKFGYTTLRNDNTGRSVILGGTDIIPIEHVQAYGVFANGGDFVQHEVITRVVDREGNTVYEHSPERVPVGDPQGIYVLNATMNNMYGDISWEGRDVAGKTGTTQGQRDMILMLYSPDFVTMGWVGNSDNSPLTSWESFGSTVVKPWLINYMKDIGNASYFSAKTSFTRPGGILQGGGPCPPDGNCSGGTGLMTSYIIEDRFPPEDIQYHTLRVCDDQPDKLARQIDEDTGHAIDRRFTIYKHFVPSLQYWFDRYLESRGTPNVLPTESCSVDRNPSGSDNPWTVLSSPSSGATFSGTINVAGTAYTTSGGISSVEFYLDGSLLGEVTTIPFDQTYSIPGGLDNGTYNFLARAYDDSGRSGDTNVSVIVGDTTTSNLTITSPTGTVNYDGVTPITIRGNYTGPTSINRVEVFVSKSGGDFTSVGNLNLGTWRLSWAPAHEDADYQLFLRASAGSTGTLQSTTYSVTVKAT